MITKDQFQQLVMNLGPYAENDIAWAENLKPPSDPDQFARDTIFVICNSGMKNTVARLIYGRVMTAINGGGSAQDAFGHKGKAAAIDKVWSNRARYFAEYMAAGDKVAYGLTLPWIGKIVVFHLVKNFGADVAKPDVHLQRLADREGVTAQQLCDRLAAATGYRVATVDTILWRACALGLINSRTGVIDWTMKFEAA